MRLHDCGRRGSSIAISIPVERDLENRFLRGPGGTNGAAYHPGAIRKPIWSSTPGRWNGRAVRSLLQPGEDFDSGAA